jgi:6-pyruvoyltetrahydropterin/6-carboxytetrahydropterin synthase
VIQLTRRYPFAASHRLHAPGLSEEENQRLYGKCNNPFGHGHNYVLNVSVVGPVDDASGSAVSVPVLDRMVRESVLQAFDHRNLNEEIEAFRELVPTTENVTLEIRRRLQEAWPRYFNGLWPKLRKIRIEETGRNIFEINESC